MTVYATVYETDTKRSISPSVDSTFNSLEDVIKLMGDKYHFLNKRMLIYKLETTSVVYSVNVKFLIDDTDNSE